MKRKTILLAFVGTLFLIMLFGCIGKQEPFDEQKWRDRNTTDTQREAMANDLISKNILIGKSLKDAIKILGSNYGYISGYPNTIAYYLGNTYLGKEYRGHFNCLSLNIENDTVRLARIQWTEWFTQI